MVSRSFQRALKNYDFVSPDVYPLGYIICRPTTTGTVLTGSSLSFLLRRASTRTDGVNSVMTVPSVGTL